LNARRDVVKNSIADLEQQARDAGETMFRQSRELAEAQFEHAAEAMANKYRIE
jgi:hypothetical protein